MPFWCRGILNRDWNLSLLSLPFFWKAGSTADIMDCLSEGGPEGTLQIMIDLGFLSWNQLIN